jgi:hypothetical protein
MMNNTEDVTLPMNGGGDEGSHDTAPLLKEIRADLTQLMNLTRQRWEHDNAFQTEMRDFQSEVRQRWTRDDEFQAEVRQRLHEIEVQVGLLHKDQFRIRTDAAMIAQRVEQLERQAS